MRITKITFHNFRQFYGLHTFEFAHVEGRPATLIYGANGSGKTTFLNAFTWTLYGTFSDDVEVQNRLINNHAWEEVAMGEDGFAEVSLTFIHDNRHYEVSRRVEATRVNDSSIQNAKTPYLSLIIHDESNVPRESASPQFDINTVLPKNLSHFFFFNGERMEKLIKNSSYADVKKEVKGLLDLSQVERAANDSLPMVQRMLTAELKKEDNGQASQIEEDIQAKQRELEHLRRTQEDVSKNINENEKYISALKAEQQKNEKILPLLTERDKMELVIKETSEHLVSLEYELQTAISDNGFLAFTDRLTTSSRKKIEELQQHGILSAPLSKEFLNSLLKEEKCVCGTALPKGSEARASVEDAEGKLSTNETTHFWNNLEGKIPSIVDKRATLRGDIHTIRQDLIDTRERKDRAIRRRAEVVAQLETSEQNSDNPLDSVRLQEQIIVKEKEITAWEFDLRNIKRQIADSEAELNSLKNQRNAAQASGEAAERIRRRIKVVEELTEALHEIYENRATRLNTYLNDRLRENYDTISHQSHEPYLTEDFEIGLKSRGYGKRVEVAKSTGENQILTISFLAAVSEAAQERIQKGSSSEVLALQEKEFPIVMDAAFGALDESYQRKVVELLTGISSQLVILVSKSQGQGQVDAALENHLANRGVIITHTTAENAHSENLVVGAHEFPYITKDELDYSEIYTIEG